MRRIRLLLLAGAVMAAAVLCVGAASSRSPEKADDIEQLRNAVAALRGRVDALEERLKDGVVVIPRGDGRQGPPVIDPFPWPRQVPRDWRPFEFNGRLFYVIPIANSRPPAPPAQKRSFSCKDSRAGRV